MGTFRELAESLSPSARKLLLRDGAELERENARTRQFIEKFRLPNPLRVLHAGAYEMTRVGAQPSQHRLLPDDRAVVDELQFHFSGEYESANTTFDRWIGPDGCIYIECTSSRRFFSVLFEDDHRISMWPDLQENNEELWPTTDFLVSSGDLLDDYRRMLEKTAEYVSEARTRPLHRYADSRLDLECVDFYQRHQTPLAWVRFAMSTRFWDTVAEKFPGLGGDLMSPDDARAMVAEFTSCGRLAREEVVLECRSCSDTVYVPFDELGGATRCPGCDKQLGTTDWVLRVSDGDAMQRLIDRASIPVVVCFWSPERWESVMGAGFLHDAAIRSDSAFLSLLVDVSVMDEVAATHVVTEAPTFVRFRDGKESGRQMGSMSAEGVLTFATAGQ